MLIIMSVGEIQKNKKYTYERQMKNSKYDGIKCLKIKAHGIWEKIFAVYNNIKGYYNIHEEILPSTFLKVIFNEMGMNRNRWLDSHFNALSMLRILNFILGNVSPHLWFAIYVSLDFFPKNLSLFILVKIWQWEQGVYCLWFHTLSLLKSPDCQIKALSLYM